jgi:hypothetical protein
MKDMRTQAQLLLVTAAALAMQGCAGASVGSGVGDAYFEGAPYYAGRVVPPGGTIAHLPISFQRGATQPQTFDPSDRDGTPVAALLAEMNAYLDSLGVTVRVDARPTGTAPNVQFGCERVPDDDCEDADSRRPHRLAVGRPSRTWVDWANAQAAEVGADRVLILTLEVGNYMPRQRNWRGSKEVQLGTGYVLDLPWLTGIDKPISVLQLTGALIDAEGRAVRIGAEGLIARRTNLLVASLGAQAIISDDDVEQIRTSRRQDLRDQPLVWQAALSNMVAQLTGNYAVELR